MRNLTLLIISILMLISCNKENNEIKPEGFYINFKIKDHTGMVSNVKFPYEQIQNINGNDVKDSHFVWVGFGFSALFQNPTNQSISQELTFYLSIQVPEEELIIDSNKYKFISPENYQNYIPTGNIFDQKNISFSTFFHEDISTFCSAQNDENFNNTFEISSKEYFIDENQEDTMIVEGTFSTKYNSVCGNNSFEISAGTFRIKLLIDEIP